MARVNGYQQALQQSKGQDLASFLNQYGHLLDDKDEEVDDGIGEASALYQDPMDFSSTGDRFKDQERNRLLAEGMDIEDINRQLGISSGMFTQPAGPRDRFAERKANQEFLEEVERMG